MVVRLATTCAVNAYHCEFESAHGEKYSIQYYAIKFVNDLRFSLGTPGCFINKTYSVDINEIFPITTKVVSSKHLNTGLMG